MSSIKDMITKIGAEPITKCNCNCKVEKQIEEMANIPTKEEIEARNKIGKEKDELRQALLHYATAEASGGIKSLIDCEGCAFYLYESLGYRKLPEDSVVLSKEEYEKLKNENKTLLDSAKMMVGCFCDQQNLKEQERKETAEKILYALADTLTNEVVTRENICYFVKSFADFYGLETDFSFMNSQNNSVLK